MIRFTVVAAATLIGLDPAAAQVMGYPPENFEQAFQERDGSAEKGVFYASCFYTHQSRYNDVYLFVPRTDGELTLLFFHRNYGTVGNIAVIKMKSGHIEDVEPLSGAIGMAEEMRTLAVPLMNGPLKLTYDISQVFATEPTTTCGKDRSDYFKTEATAPKTMTWWRRLLIRWNKPAPPEPLPRK